MGLYEHLLSTFGQNEPILFREIQYQDYSKAWICKELNRLCVDGQLIRYEKGVYYIPKETALGVVPLNPRKVIEKKYISDGQSTMGYYSGLTFFNQLGLSTQMPNVLELYTNQETSKVREALVGSQKVLLRRARTEINSQNAGVLSFLELMNTVPPGYLDDERRKKVSQYIRQKGISRKDITEYAPVFPDKAMRTLVESEVIYDVAP